MKDFNTTDMADALDIKAEFRSASVHQWLMELVRLGYHQKTIAEAGKLLGIKLLEPYRTRIFQNDPETYQYLETRLTNLHKMSSIPAIPPMGLHVRKEACHPSQGTSNRGVSISQQGGNDEAIEVDK